MEFYLFLFACRLFVFPRAKSTSGLEGLFYKVAQVVIHPNYVHNPLVGPFDIALIRLAGRISNIPHACLPAIGTSIIGVCGIAGEYRKH